MNGRDDDDIESGFSEDQDHTLPPPLPPLQAPPPAVRRLDFGLRVTRFREENEVDEGFGEPEHQLPVPIHRQEPPPVYEDPPMEVSDDEGLFDGLPLLYPMIHRLSDHANEYGTEEDIQRLLLETAQESEEDGLQEHKTKKQEFSQNDSLSEGDYQVLLQMLALEEAKKRNPPLHGLLTSSNPEPASQPPPVPSRRPRAEFRPTGFSFNPSPSSSVPEQLPSTSGFTEEDARRASERFEEELFREIEECRSRNRKRTEE